MTWAALTEHWPSLATAGAGLGAGGLVKTWLDHQRAVRRASDEIAMSLVQQLSARVASVEASAAQERALCDAHLAALRDQVGCLSGLFDNLLIVAELAPERVREFAARITERRARQEHAEAAVTAPAPAAATPKGADR